MDEDEEVDPGEDCWRGLCPLIFITHPRAGGC